MVYNALGHNAGECWGGICQLPFLKTLTHWENPGDYGGGGYWRDAETLIVDAWAGKESSASSPRSIDPLLPFRAFSESSRGEIGWKRRARDGWRQIVFESKDWTWECQPSSGHPRITMHGIDPPWRFECPDIPGFLDNSVTDVAWNSRDQLLVAKAGWLERYTHEDLERGEPGFRYDLNPLQPKWA